MEKEQHSYHVTKSEPVAEARPDVTTPSGGNPMKKHDTGMSISDPNAKAAIQKVTQTLRAPGGVTSVDGQGVVKHNSGSRQVNIAGYPVKEISTS